MVTTTALKREGSLIVDIDRGFPQDGISIGFKEDSAPKMMKNDEEKLRWDLLPFEPVEDFVKILTYGMKKYKKNNWKNGKSNADIERTFAAFMRHINSYRQGEELDPESGLPHIYHAFADLGFILYHYDTKKKLERNWD